MARISLWKSHKGNDYKMADRVSSEYIYTGGAGIFVHKYLGVGDSDDVGKIQDLLFLENRDRNYSSEVVELRGHFSPIDTDYDLSQFGIFLSSDTLRFDFHYNDMIDKIGRKLMSGDVFEVPAERDVNLDGVIVNSYYVVEDAMYSSSGYSMTWNPHIWKVRTKKLDGSPEYDKIFENAANRGTLGNEGEFTGLMPQGIADLLEGDMYDQGTKDAISRYGKFLDINDAIIEEAQCNVYFDPKFFNGSHFYIEVDDNGYPDLRPWRTGTGEPPNGGLLRGIGTVFPDNMEDGEFFLRVDYAPDRLFQKQGNRYIKIEDDLRKVWTAYNTRLDTYIDNNNVTTLQDGTKINEKTSLHTVLDPKVDLNKDKKKKVSKQKSKDSFIAKSIGNVGSQDRGWGCTSDKDLICDEDSSLSNIHGLSISIPDGTYEIAPTHSLIVSVNSPSALSSANITVNDFTFNSVVPLSLNMSGGVITNNFSLTLPTSFDLYRDTISINLNAIHGGESNVISGEFNQYINGFQVPINDVTLSFNAGDAIGSGVSTMNFDYNGIDPTLLQYGPPEFTISGSDVTASNLTHDEVNKSVQVDLSGNQNTYNYNSPITISAMSPTNRYELIHSISAPVVTTVPFIVNDNLVNLDVDEINTVPIQFSQHVRIISSSVTNDSGSTINNTYPPHYVNKFDLSVDNTTNTYVDSDIRYITIRVETMDNRFFDLTKPFMILGEKLKNITITFPDDSVVLPFISDINDIISIDATLDTSPPLQFTMNYVNDQYLMITADQYTILENNGVFTLLINKNDLLSFYYDVGVTITLRILHR